MVKAILKYNLDTLLKAHKGIDYQKSTKIVGVLDGSAGIELCKGKSEDFDVS